MALKRLDILLVERQLAESRERAQALIMAGEVWSGERRLDKASQRFDETLPLEVRSRAPLFASRAGGKLDFALDRFGIDVTGKTCLDVGASTGGFTDCLLRRGASRVFAVDVGYGQLDIKLRNDPRVVVMERTNARELTREALAEKGDAGDIRFACVDVSFISAALVLPALCRVLAKPADIALLFKPQFEVGREAVGRGGVVRSEEAVTVALTRVGETAAAHGLRLVGGPEKSPLPGKKSGNVELLLHYALS